MKRNLFLVLFSLTTAALLAQHHPADIPSIPYKARKIQQVQYHILTDGTESEEKEYKTFEYNEKGQLLLQSDSSISRLSIVSVFTQRHTYKDSLIKKTVIDSDGFFSFTILMEYLYTDGKISTVEVFGEKPDNKRLGTEYVEYSNVGDTLKITDKSVLPLKSIIKSYVDDKLVHKYEKVSYFDIQTTRYVYNSEGQVASTFEKEGYREKAQETETRFVYNEQGDVVMEKKVKSYVGSTDTYAEKDYIYKTIYKYEYDDRNNWIAKVEKEYMTLGSSLRFSKRDYFEDSVEDYIEHSPVYYSRTLYYWD